MRRNGSDMSTALVLQMHRLGDLILSFPLLHYLQRHTSCRNVWVVAEPAFFQPLLTVAPSVTFFPAAQGQALAASQPFELGINLSSRPASARILGGMRAGRRLGLSEQDGRLRAYGFWQLYRQALTQNNRGNPFHWSDLNVLDLVPDADLHAVGHPLPRPAGTGRVGLVLGASEAAKHPSPHFWARLARRLAAGGHMPLFLGGEAEKPLGRETARLSGLPQADLCGKLPLDALVSVMRRLDLCITPDTGPMHLAGWLGVPVLNLSLGPVHARETGPSSPGQWVVRAAMSCTGCWQCRRGTLSCHGPFAAPAVARVAEAVMRHGDGLLRQPPDLPPGLELFRTERNNLGLHQLRPVGARRRCVRGLLEDFWQACFLTLCRPAHAVLLPPALEALAASPLPPARLVGGLQAICMACARHVSGRAPLPHDFWRSHPPLLRLAAGFCQMWLENAQDDRHQQERLLHDLHGLIACLRQS